MRTLIKKVITLITKIITMSTTTQPIDKNSVMQAALQLIARNGKTTSLEVKQELRAQGYWAKQSTVSSILQEVQSEQNWKKEEAGGHLEYSLPTMTTFKSARQVAVVNVPLTPLQTDIIQLIKDTVWSHGSTAPNIELHHDLSTDLGMDHLNMIQVGMAIDGKYGIATMKEDWAAIDTIKDIIDIVVKLDPALSFSNTNQSVVHKKIVEIIADKLGVDINEVNVTTHITNDLGADSLDAVELTMEFEREFVIDIPDHEADKLNTVHDIVQYVESKLNKVAAKIATNVAAKLNPTAPATTTKTPRKKKSVINDSMNPSKDPRVTINIDYKKTITGRVEAKQTGDANDWYVSIGSANADPVIFDKKYTSDNVRTVYARLKGKKIQEIRASRIKNL